MTNSNDCCQTSPNVSIYIAFLYLCAVVVWFILIWALEVPLNDFLDFIIFFIPLGVFAIAIGSLGHETMTREQEGYIIRTNYSSALTLLLSPILIWATTRVEDNRSFLLIVITATALVLLTFYDFWVNTDWFPMIKHMRTIVQAYSITLMIFALKIFCVDRLRYADTQKADQALHDHYGKLFDKE